MGAIVIKVVEIQGMVTAFEPGLSANSKKMFFVTVCQNLLAFFLFSDFCVKKC